MTVNLKVCTVCDCKIDEQQSKQSRERVKNSIRSAFLNLGKLSPIKPIRLCADAVLFLVGDFGNILLTVFRLLIPLSYITLSAMVICMPIFIFTCFFFVTI